MDCCRNVAVPAGLSSGFQPEQVLSPSFSQPGSLDDLFSGHQMESDVGLEWLSMFVEDCFSSSGNCISSAVTSTKVEKKLISPSPRELPSEPLQLERPTIHSSLHSLHKFVVPGKARSKMKRAPRAKSRTPITSSSWSKYIVSNPYDPCFQMVSSDPPLLQQAHWLADSELIILPRKDESKEGKTQENNEGKMNGNDKECLEVVIEGENQQEQQQQQQPRRCTHCLSQRTPQWRAGPMGPKTLCNACGVRYKSGRLLPEYRPAKSPTFVSYKHSNSHKKVMEMRMALMSSSNSS